mgnify:FL=1
MAKLSTTLVGESLPFNAGRVRDVGETRRWLYPTEVEMPAETFGECTLSHVCKNFAVELADGWCIRHWDKYA